MKNPYKIVEIITYKNGQKRFNILDRCRTWIAANNAYRRFTADDSGYTDDEICDIARDIAAFYSIALYDTVDKQIYRERVYIENGVRYE